MNWRQRTTIFTVIIIGLALSGCKAGQFFGSTVTPTFTPTATNTLTPTSTITPSVTPSPIPSLTPTETPLEITTDFSGGLAEILKRIGRVRIEDIESGKYAAQERRMFENGEIAPFSEKAVPFPERDGMYIADENTEARVLIGAREYHDGTLDTDIVPYKMATVSMTEINGVDILVIGVKNLNADGSISFTHFGMEAFGRNLVMTHVDTLIEGTIQLVPVFEMHEKFMDARGFDSYLYEPTMYEYLQETSGSRMPLVKEWVKTRNVPKELENKLMMMSMSGW